MIGRLLHTQVDRSGSLQENAVIAMPSGPELHFGPSRYLTVDGNSGVRMRSPRYCAATGELYYTVMTGPAGQPGRNAEIWTARARQSPPQAAASVADLSVDDTWLQLFNGRDLSGWRIVGGKTGIEVRDGLLLVSTPVSMPGGWIMTEAEFGDFELQLDYRLETGSNTGVFLRIPEYGKPNGGDFLEVQLTDDRFERFRDKPDWSRCGGIYGVQAPYGTVPNPLNTWHTLRIAAIGPQISVRIDDQLISSTHVDTATVRKSSPIPHLKRRKGRIGLNRPGTAEFRNIRIRRLFESTSE